MDVTEALYTTRPFAAGAFSFVVASSDHADRALIESLFADLPGPAPDSDPPSVFALLRIDTEDGPRWSLRGPRAIEHFKLTRVGSLTSLMAAVNLSALDAEPDSLHLHAAAAIKNGQAVIIAAQRDTGKTTTVAHLVERGWEFVTDETVRLSRHHALIGGFSKPLSIKPGGDRLVDHLHPWMIPPLSDGAESFRFVSLGAAGAVIASGAPPHLVILLRRPDGEPSPHPVSRAIEPADAVVALMQETLDAERFGSAAVRLAELAASTRCYELTIGTPAQTAAHIDELFAQPPVEAHEVRVLTPSDSVNADVVTVGLGDWMVIHHAGTGQIFALNPSAAQIWEQIGGWHDAGVDLQGPVIRQFVEQLRGLGALADATVSGHERVGQGEQ